MIPDVHGVDIVDSSDKKILNAGKGVCNYIPRKDMFEYIQTTFHAIAERLVSHCGPYSKYALVVSPSGGKIETNIFTKDGRNIINCMEFSSPMEEIFKNMMMYIATRVDNKAGDGTTSSMILASRFFEFVCLLYKDKRLNTRDFANSYNEFHNSLMKYLDKQRITIDELVGMVYDKSLSEISFEEYQHVVSFLARCQCMTSSGGDTKLADAIAEIYTLSPKETWSYTNVHHQKIETDKLYSVDVNDNDFTLNSCIMLDRSMLNSNLGTEYVNEKCDLLILPERMTDAGIYVDVVNTYIKTVMTDPDRKQDLVIVAPKISGPVNYNIEDFNSKTTGFRIITCEHHEQTIPSSISMELLGLSYASGITPFQPSRGFGCLTDAFLVTDVSIIYKCGRLFINGIFNHALERVHATDKKVNGIAHPFYTYPELSSNYTMFIAHLQKMIEDYKNDVNQDRYYNTIQVIEELIAIMTTPRRPRLLVGGNSHDHAASIDVIRDVCGAINTSLSKGFVVGSAFALERAIHEYATNEQHSNFCTSLYLAVQELLYITKKGETPESFDTSDPDTTLELLSDFNEICEKGLHTNINTTYCNLLKRDKDGICQLLFENIVEIYSSYKETGILSTDNYPIIQPCTVFEQLLERIGDLMIKLITTDSIVVPGAIYLKETKKPNQMAYLPPYSNSNGMIQLCGSSIPAIDADNKPFTTSSK